MGAFTGLDKMTWKKKRKLSIDPQITPKMTPCTLKAYAGHLSSLCTGAAPFTQWWRHPSHNCGVLALFMCVEEETQWLLHPGPGTQVGGRVGISAGCNFSTWGR